MNSETTGHIRALRAGLLGLALVAACCAPPPRFPGSGELAGHAFVGPVDHPLASALLAGERPPELEPLRRELASAGRLPDVDELASIARRSSPDVAALLFVEAVARHPRHAAARAVFEEELAAARAAPASEAGYPGAEEARVLFVPGWLYASHGEETGSDMARPRRLLEQMGVANELVAVDENGAVEANAQLVAAAVRARADSGERLVLVSASKSSAEVALALGALLEEHETRHVLAWLSIGGVPRGSPLADRALRPELGWLSWLAFRLDGLGLAGLSSLRRARRRDAFEALRFPAHLLRVAYVAVPLSGEVGERGRRGYACLRAHGPNDGLTLLGDELLPGGVVLVEPGVDHFFELPDRDERTAALLRSVLRLASEQRAEEVLP